MHILSFWKIIFVHASDQKYSRFGLIEITLCNLPCVEPYSGWYYIRNTQIFLLVWVPKNLECADPFLFSHFLYLKYFPEKKGNVKLTTPISLNVSTLVLISRASCASTNLYLELVSPLCQKQFLIKMKERRWSVNQKQKHRTSLSFEPVERRRNIFIRYLCFH